ncbi:hypothetical protein WDW86_02970 [Bdellovibrionota bacterium FG-2]
MLDLNFLNRWLNRRILASSLIALAITGFASAQDVPPSIQTAFVDFLHCKQNPSLIAAHKLEPIALKFPGSLEFFTEVVPTSPQANDALLIETFSLPLATRTGKKLAIPLRLELTPSHGIGVSSSGHTVFSFPRNSSVLSGAAFLSATLTLDGITENYSCTLASEE